MSNANRYTQDITDFLANNRFRRGKTDNLEIMRLLKKFFEEERRKFPLKNRTDILTEFGSYFKRSGTWAHSYACVEILPQKIMERLVKDGKLLISITEAYHLSRMKGKEQETFLEAVLEKARKRTREKTSGAPQGESNSQVLEQPISSSRKKPTSSSKNGSAWDYMSAREPEESQQIRIVEGRGYRRIIGYRY